MTTRYRTIPKEIETNGVKHVVRYQQKISVMCKTCKQYTRRDGSAYCEDCADKYKNEQ